jgi:hypothetical protein
MILPAIACAETHSNGDTTPAETAETKAPAGEASDEVTESLYDEGGYLKDSLPESLKYNNDEICILHWNDAYFEEFSSPGENGEVVNDALYSRNCRVEDRLNIRLKFVGTPGDTYNEAPFALKLSTSIESGDREYDIVGAYSYTAGLCAAQSLYYNLNEVEHLDFDKPWWPDLLVDQATINNKLYFVSGDVSANAIYMMYVTFFNKEFLDEMKLTDPYELVEKNEWTLDKMFEMCKGTYSDLNTNGTKDEGDRIGLYTYTLHLDSFLWGSNIFIIDSIGDDFKFSDEILGEKTVNLQTKLQNFLYSTDGGFNTKQKDNNHEYFAQGLSLFWNDRCHRAIDFTEAGREFGILPIAKYDADQTEYISIMSNPFTLYGMPSDVVDPDMAGAVLECMASESYRLVTPALYEKSFKMRYSQDSVSAQMFDIVKGGVVFDMARIFSNTISVYKAWQKAIVGNTAWSTTVKTDERVWNTQLEKVLQAFK